MKKIAIFTEGQTEQLFACEAIKQLAGNSKYYITKVRKNGKGAKLIKMDYGVVGEKDGHDIYFQILNCDSDSQVMSTIREEYKSLLDAGFQQIIGIRDLHPLPRDKLPNVLAGIEKHTPKGAVEPLIIISIMEVEAWFMAENTHFLKIDPSLSATFIQQEIGIDINLDSETFEVPSDVLHSIYQLSGKSYLKSKDQVMATVEALNISEYDGEAGAKAKSIAPLIVRLKEVFASA